MELRDYKMYLTFIIRVSQFTFKRILMLFNIVVKCPSTYNLMWKMLIYLYVFEYF